MKKLFLLPLLMMLISAFLFQHVDAQTTDTPTATDTAIFTPTDTSTSAPTSIATITDTPTATDTAIITPTNTATSTLAVTITDTPPAPTATTAPDAVPTWQLDNRVTYGDYIQIIQISMLCIGLMLLGIACLIGIFVVPRK